MLKCLKFGFLLGTLWRNLHMFLDILEFIVESKKLFRENSFENLVSDLQKNYLCVHKTTFRKSAKTKKNEKNIKKV